MFTVCPKCTLTLAVTAADLRAGQGYVRCGRCTNVFNALLQLSEEPDGAAAQGLPAPPAPAQALPEQPIQSTATGTFETIVLEGDAITQTEEIVPEEDVNIEIAALNERLDAANEEREAEEYTFDAGVDDSLPPPNENLPHSPEPSAQAPVEQPAPPGFSSSRLAVWLAGSAALLLLLGIQVIHHYRNELATRAGWDRPLSRLYAAIGVPLTPHWNLGAYDVRQQGALTDPATGSIQVRVSLANRATRAQPLPILRLTLLDRYGKRVAARDLQPAEYLPKNQPSDRFLAPDERIDTQVAVHDPGGDTSSFQLDVCLKGGGALLRCTDDNSATVGN